MNEHYEDDDINCHINYWEDEEEIGNGWTLALGCMALLVMITMVMVVCLVEVNV